MQNIACALIITYDIYRYPCWAWRKGLYKPVNWTLVSAIVGS